MAETEYYSLTPTFIIYLNGVRFSAEQEASVIEIAVNERINVPSSFTIQMADENRKWIDFEEFSEGSAIKILMGYKDKIEEVISGELTGLTANLRLRTVTLTGKDKLHRLATGRKIRAYTEMTDADIIARLASESGLSSDIDFTGVNHSFTVQKDQTNLSYIKTIARKNNRVVYSKNGTLHFKKREDNSTEEVILEYCKTLLEFRPELKSNKLITEVEVRGWDNTSDRVVVGTMTANDIKESIGSGTIGNAKAQENTGDIKEIHIDMKINDINSAEQRATDILTLNSMNYITATGKTQGHNKIRTGMYIELKELGEKFSGEYYVTAVKHRLDTLRGYITEFYCLRNMIGDVSGGSLSNIQNEQYKQGVPPPREMEEQEAATAKETPDTGFDNLIWLNRDEEEITEVNAGDAVRLNTDIRNMEEGESFTVKVFEKNKEYNVDKYIESFDVRVKDSKLNIEWKAKITESDETNTGEDIHEKSKSREYVFRIFKGNEIESVGSATLRVYGELDVDFVDVPDVLFNHNSAVPCLDKNGWLIQAAASAFVFANEYPDKELVLFGHTDRSGDDEYNFDLSELRVKAYKAILDNDESAWDDVRKKKSKIEDRQRILKTLTEKHGWPCDPGAVDNLDGKKTRGAVRHFQEYFNNNFDGNLKVDGIFGKNTFRAMLGVYRHYIKEAVKKTTGKDSMPNITFGNKDGLFPCGESLPRTPSTEYYSKRDRRVELIFYDQGEISGGAGAAASNEYDYKHCPLTGRVWEKKIVPYGRLVSSGKKPEISNLVWLDKDGKEISEAYVGEKVKLSANVMHVKEDELLTIKIFEKDYKGKDDFIEKKQVAVKENKVQLNWMFEYTEDEDDAISDKEKMKKGHTKPEYIFVVMSEKHDLKEESGVIEMQDWFEVSLDDCAKYKLPVKKYIIYDAKDNEITKGKLDDNGYAKIELLWASEYYIVFPELEEIANSSKQIR